MKIDILMIASQLMIDSEYNEEVKVVLAERIVESALDVFNNSLEDGRCLHDFKKLTRDLDNTFGLFDAERVILDLTKVVKDETKKHYWDPRTLVMGKFVRVPGTLNICVIQMDLDATVERINEYNQSSSGRESVTTIAELVSDTPNLSDINELLNASEVKHERRPSVLQRNPTTQVVGGRRNHWR